MTHRIERIALPSSRIGTHRDLVVHRFGAPGAGPKAYVQAALHADEIPGMLVAERLIAKLSEATVTGEVVVVPVANPVGLSQVVLGGPAGRCALEDGGNFNRGFADLSGAVEERVRGKLGPDAAVNVAVVRDALRAALGQVRPVGELAALRHALLSLAIDADLVFDLHCDMEAVQHLYTGTALWPGAADLAAELGAEVVLLSSESGGNPFDEACSAPWWIVGERLGPATPLPPACLAATIELRGKADVTDALAEADAGALLRVLMRRGVVAGDPGPLPELRCAATPLTGLARITAPVAGVITYRVEPGAAVKPGDPVADIVDPTAQPGATRTRLRAETAGVVMMRSNRRFAGIGELVVSVAGAEPAPDSGRGLLFD